VPWQPNGTFLRINPDFSSINGSLWQQDLAADPSIKIVASRHDYHDQDLGDGIAACLNLDGYNSMRANLKMGGFKITGIADGNPVTFDDVPSMGQVAGSMTFDNGLRLLTLFDRAGTEIDNVTIPSGTGGGGGDGTVTSIDIGPGLQGTNDPIQTTGDIQLENLGGGQVFSGGISGITIDDYGRVTQVVEGAFANTNLGNAPSANSVLVTSSTGTDTTLLAAVAGGNAGVMTGAMAQQLADLWAQGATGMQPPIELQGIDTTIRAGLVAGAKAGLIETQCEITASGVWTDGFTVTGSGIMEYCGADRHTSLAGFMDVRIVIDGTVVWTGDNVWDDGGVADDGINMIGYCDQTYVEPVLQNVAFSSSFKIQFRQNVVGSQFMYVYAKYQKMS
jgi:hypothetical protein